MDKVIKSQEEWRKRLTSEQYRIMREKGTERPFTGEYYSFKGVGQYRCAGCGGPATAVGSGCTHVSGLSSCAGRRVSVSASSLAVARSTFSTPNVCPTSLSAAVLACDPQPHRGTEALHPMSRPTNGGMSKLLNAPSWFTSPKIS